MGKARVFFVTRDSRGKVTTKELKQLKKPKPDDLAWWIEKEKVG